jgi:tight adherence protein C
MALIFLTVAAGLILAMITSQRKDSLFQRLESRRILRVSSRRSPKFNEVKVLLEIPDFAAILWFALTAGESLDHALRIAVSRGNGYVAGVFEVLLQRVDHGALLQHELENLAAESKSEQIRELATKLAVALVTGVSLADLLADFVQSTNSTVRSVLLEKAGKNETKMMIPLVFVILPVTVMFAMFPSLVLIQQSFIK